MLKQEQMVEDARMRAKREALMNLLMQQQMASQQASTQEEQANPEQMQIASLLENSGQQASPTPSPSPTPAPPTKADAMFNAISGKDKEKFIRQQQGLPE